MEKKEFENMSFPPGYAVSAGGEKVIVNAKNPKAGILRVHRAGDDDRTTFRVPFEDVDPPDEAFSLDDLCIQRHRQRITDAQQWNAIYRILQSRKGRALHLEDPDFIRVDFFSKERKNVYPLMAYADRLWLDERGYVHARLVGEGICEDDVRQDLPYADVQEGFRIVDYQDALFDVLMSLELEKEMEEEDNPDSGEAF